MFEFHVFYICVSLFCVEMCEMSFNRFNNVKVRMGPGPTFPVEKEIPVISPVLTVRAVQIGAPPWRSMRPVDEQEVRQVCSDRHETCTLIFQLFEIYILAD